MSYAGVLCSRLSTEVYTHACTTHLTDSHAPSTDVGSDSGTNKQRDEVEIKFEFGLLLRAVVRCFWKAPNVQFHRRCRGSVTGHPSTERLGPWHTWMSYRGLRERRTGPAGFSNRRRKMMHDAFEPTVMMAFMFTSSLHRRAKAKIRLSTGNVIG